MSNTDDVTLPINEGSDGGGRDTAPLLSQIRADLTQLMNLTRQRWEHDDTFQAEARQRWGRDDEFQAEVRQRLREIEIQVGLLHKDQFRIRTDAADIAQRVEWLERKAG